MCRNANVSRLVASIGKRGARGARESETERERGEREEGYTWRESSPGFLNPVSAIIREPDNSSVYRLVVPSFCERVTAPSTSSPPRRPPFRDRVRTGPGDTPSPGENGFAPAKTIRSYVSIAAAYMHLLKGTCGALARARRAERIARELLLSCCYASYLSSYLSLRDFSRRRSISNTIGTVEYVYRR